ncbi:glutamate decarboxylase [Desulfosarcina ovata subsp. sediminis]|uniref:Glutamate decarboxylase n=1 Tax=Desulfosarcina ovata subsp. sediminis TaxID=885957 RepID=A0A5K7ZPX2_9BACT|nr:aminotransferase class V-fold PLP-dependent enzyme [Desulfosarcina ovata]BBO81220.1 glutamate decarboxylase [Desulfosarcina ovata subsp. sediminis]
MTEQKRRPQLVADHEALARTFHQPENEQSRNVLTKYMEQILFGLHDFLREHVGITEEIPLKELAAQFSSSTIARTPVKRLADVIAKIIEELAPQAVNVSSPYFIGHMTSAIPFFMVHLSTIVAALNQNPVKLETSKVVSVYERQVLAKVHRLLFNLDETFYETHIQRPESTLGSFVEDGTLANLSALWVARNRLLPATSGSVGAERDGMANALHDRGLRRVTILVSQLGHYSIRKSAGVLGLGYDAVTVIPVDRANRMDLNVLQRTLEEHCRDPETAVMAVIGIAGTTETGAVDPLPAIARICREFGVHFHVDAAWGGPVLLSERYGHLLKGIELADSVTIDGHKQFYLPMSNGMVFFKDPQAMDAVAYHAAYINRPGSVDLGIRSLVGSRAATSLVLGSALDIMGADGYALLIDHGIETARAFAEEINRRSMFELITAPELNILTYRLVPDGLRESKESNETISGESRLRMLNHVNIQIQRLQREAGNSFVSRTTLRRSGQPDTVVLRVVLMNPRTTPKILNAILDEQESIYLDSIAPSLRLKSLTP